jgi:hypothetical protein
MVITKDVVLNESLMDFPTTKKCANILRKPLGRLRL